MIRYVWMKLMCDKGLIFGCSYLFTQSCRSNLRQLISDGRFEILSGGLIMPDEALTHYDGLVQQLVAGHRWLHETLAVDKPNISWSIDAFGLSQTVSYLYGQFGIDNQVIARVHSAIKVRLCVLFDVLLAHSFLTYTAPSSASETAGIQLDFGGGQ